MMKRDELELKRGRNNNNAPPETRRVDVKKKKRVLFGV